jgi:hypothetical protein
VACELSRRIRGSPVDFAYGLKQKKRKEEEDRFKIFEKKDSSK